MIQLIPEPLDDDLQKLLNEKLEQQKRKRHHTCNNNHGGQVKDIAKERRRSTRVKRKNPKYI